QGEQNRRLLVTMDGPGGAKRVAGGKGEGGGDGAGKSSAAPAAPTGPAGPAALVASETAPRAREDAERAAGKTDGSPDELAGDSASGDRDAPVAQRPARGAHLTFGSVALGTIALGGAGGFGLLTYWGRKDNAQLSQCTPHCPSTGIDRIQTLYRYADIAGAVGAAALVGAIWIYATSGSPAAEAEAAHPQSALGISLLPASTGGVATLFGSF
ncbi:MAG TPA: hypothetical protein VNO55_27590, partial [Polyangia bacterium]|nr:hypothetical protein [Polyangia bacterium]